MGESRPPPAAPEDPGRRWSRCSSSSASRLPRPSTPLNLSTTTTASPSGLGCAAHDLRCGPRCRPPELRSRRSRRSVRSSPTRRRRVASRFRRSRSPCPGRPRPERPPGHGPGRHHHGDQDGVTGPHGPGAADGDPAEDGRRPRCDRVLASRLHHLDGDIGAFAQGLRAPSAIEGRRYRHSGALGSTGRGLRGRPRTPSATSPPAASASSNQLWQYPGRRVAGVLPTRWRSTAASNSDPSFLLAPAGSSDQSISGWLGAFASLGLPGVDILVDHSYSAALGLDSPPGADRVRPGAQRGQPVQSQSCSRPFLVRRSEPCRRRPGSQPAC